MTELILMLTKDDITIADCLSAYEQVRDTDVKWVGFKDIGPGTDTLRELTRRIHADGRHAVLEVVSEDQQAEMRSVSGGTDLGVDLIMGGTRVRQTAPVSARSGISYYPFAGTVQGHPSRLAGTLSDIVASAKEISSHPDVSGLDLLAYRWLGDVPELIRQVVAAVDVPVVVAGSIHAPARFAAARNGGAWGLTVGTAAVTGELMPGGSFRDQVNMALQLTMSAS
jgi:hypothetical protein